MMDNKLKLQLVELLLGNATDTQNESPLIGKDVLVRTYSAGVHLGRLKQKDGTNVLLENAQRIREWHGAFSLNEVATKGISDGRVSCPIGQLELTEAIELLPFNKEALDSVKKYQV